MAKKTFPHKKAVCSPVFWISIGLAKLTVPVLREAYLYLSFSPPRPGVRGILGIE